MKELNHIKRKSNTLVVKTKVSFNNGVLPADTIVTVTREIDFGWVGGGYQWSLAVLRNAELVEILEQI